MSIASLANAEVIQKETETQKHMQTDINMLKANKGGKRKNTYGNE